MGLCQFFGFTVDEGAQAYAVAEIFLGIYNIILGSLYAYEAAEYADKYETEAVPFGIQDLPYYKSIYVLHIGCACLASALLLHAFVGFALYPFGYKDKINAVCWLWIGSASFLLLNFVSMTGIICAYPTVPGKDPDTRQIIWTIDWKHILRIFYLLYPIIGIIIICPFLSSPVHQRRVIIDTNPMVEELESDDYDEDSHHHRHHHSHEEEIEDPGKRGRYVKVRVKKSKHSGRSRGERYS